MPVLEDAAAAMSAGAVPSPSLQSALAKAPRIAERKAYGSRSKAVEELLAARRDELADAAMDQAMDCGEDEAVEEEGEGGEAVAAAPVAAAAAAAAVAASSSSSGSSNNSSSSSSSSNSSSSSSSSSDHPALAAVLRALTAEDRDASPAAVWRWEVVDVTHLGDAAAEAAVRDGRAEAGRQGGLVRALAKLVEAVGRRGAGVAGSKEAPAEAKLAELDAKVEKARRGLELAATKRAARLKKEAEAAKARALREASAEDRQRLKEAAAVEAEAERRRKAEEREAAVPERAKAAEMNGQGTKKRKRVVVEPRVVSLSV
jgi:hypothetical protein